MMQGVGYFVDAINNIPPEIQKQVNMSMTISDKIANALQKKNMNQKDFARLMGKTETEVSRWLAGRHNFTISTLAKISVKLKIDFF